MQGRVQQPYLTVKEAADLLRVTPRAIHERTSHRSIPMRKLAATRKILFVASELLAWVDGAELETLEKPDGTVIVRPKAQEALATA